MFWTKYHSQKMTKSIIVIIPARGGSKRVVGKNSRPLVGISLVERAVNVALEAGFKSSVIVSTESIEISQIAEAAGARVIMRPAELASDNASTESVLLQVLDVLETEGDEPEWVMTLPPTSPFRKASTIKFFITELDKKTNNQDCLMSVTEDRGDYWRMTDANGSIVRLLSHAPRRQQDREPMYGENSAIYLTKCSALRETGSILGKKVRGFPIDLIEAFDINTEIDFSIAEAMVIGMKELADN